MTHLLGVLAAATIMIVTARTPARALAPVRSVARPERAGAPSRLAERLDRADMDLDPDKVPRLWLAMVVVGALLGFVVAGAPGAVTVSIGAAAGPPAWISLRGDRRRARSIGSLPELLELVARSLRGGTDLHAALHDAADAVPVIGVSLRPALARVDVGARLGDALDRWVTDLDHPDAAIVRSVLRLGDDTGAAMAGAVDRAAATLRERAALRDEIVALTTQTRASSTVVALAPLGFLVVVATTDPRSAEVLFTTSWGRLCLVAGLGLDAVGIVWMRRLTSRVGR